MNIQEKRQAASLPRELRPLLRGLQWNNLDLDEDKEDIIVNVINEGTFAQWKWLISAYGKEEIRRVLKNRLETELHPESRRLAEVIFSISAFRHARRSAR